MNAVVIAGPWIVNAADKVGETAEVAPNAISGPQYLSVIIGFVLPLLVALVTRFSTRPMVKSILLLALSGVTSFLTEWLTAMTSAAVFDWPQVLLGTLMTFAMGVAAYFGLWSSPGSSGVSIDAHLKNTFIKDKAA